MFLHPENWKYPPFNTTLSYDSQGREIVIGRGSKDWSLRTVYVTFVPEEEIGGERGMKCLANSNEFDSIFGKVDLVLAEESSIKMNASWHFMENEFECSLFFSYFLNVFRGFKIEAEGTSGHGAAFLTNLATDKLAMFEKLGDVTTINLNMINGGTSLNVVPRKLKPGLMFVQLQRLKRKI